MNNGSFNNLNSGAGNKLIGDSGSKSNSGFKDRLNRDQIIWTETILNQWIQSCGQLKNLVLDKEGKLLGAQMIKRHRHLEVKRAPKEFGRNPLNKDLIYNSKDVNQVFLKSLNNISKSNSHINLNLLDELRRSFIWKFF